MIDVVLAGDNAIVIGLAAAGLPVLPERVVGSAAEAAEGRDAFLEKRDPDWSPFPWYF